MRITLWTNPVLSITHRERAVGDERLCGAPSKHGAALRVTRHHTAVEVTVCAVGITWCCAAAVVQVAPSVAVCAQKLAAMNTQRNPSIDVDVVPLPVCVDGRNHRHALHWLKDRPDEIARVREWICPFDVQDRYPPALKETVFVRRLRSFSRIGGVLWRAFHFLNETGSVHALHTQRATAAAPDRPADCAVERE